MSEFWVQKKVLITGVAGFIGSRLAGALRQRQAVVIGFNRQGASSSPAGGVKQVAGVDYIKGDIGDFSSLTAMLRECAVDVIFHLAAESDLEAARLNPRATFEINIRGTWNLLEAVRVLGSPVAVVTASSAGVGEIEYHRQSQGEFPEYLSSPYLTSKFCSELLSQTYFQHYGIQVCCGRLTNVYGEGDLNFKRLIPGTILSIARGEIPIIHGKGKVKKDFLYVGDAVEGYLKLAEAMLQGKINGESFTFCSGTLVSLREVVEIILAAMHRPDLEPFILGNGPAPSPAAGFSSLHAKERLGWSPQVSLTEGIRSSIKWYQQLAFNLQI